jgi:hypothetical protein
MNIDAIYDSLREEVQEGRNPASAYEKLTTQSSGTRQTKKHLNSVAEDTVYATLWAMHTGEAFPAGESAISETAETSIAYATEVLKAPFPAGEENILNSLDIDGIINYTQMAYPNGWDEGLDFLIEHAPSADINEFLTEIPMDAPIKYEKRLRAELEATINGMDPELPKVMLEELTDAYIQTQLSTDVHEYIVTRPTEQEGTDSFTRISSGSEVINELMQAKHHDRT